MSGSSSSSQRNAAERISIIVAFWAASPSSSTRSIDDLHRSVSILSATSIVMRARMGQRGNGYSGMLMDTFRFQLLGIKAESAGSRTTHPIVASDSDCHTFEKPCLALPEQLHKGVHAPGYLFGLRLLVSASCLGVSAFILSKACLRPSASGCITPAPAGQTPGSALTRPQIFWP